MAEKEQCQCVLCKSHIEFNLDSFLIDEIRSENIAIFGGSGISTETSYASPHSLYVELAHEVGITTDQMPFPDLAQKVADKPDGRFRLLQIIQERFDYIDKFRDLRDTATKFHKELATMPYFNLFITTNWDRYFETHCAAKPFVYDADMRFWNVPRRKVLKVHGTIDDYSSIVATRSDYKNCEKRLQKSLVGSKLKEILATKTCLFIGYSLKDDDIREIFSFVRKSLGEFDKAHFFISPDDPSIALPKHVKHIKTGGTFFLSSIKAHMCATGCYATDQSYDLVAGELEQLLLEHAELYERYEATEFPQILLIGSYQDGLIHGYEMILDGMKTGRFSDLHQLQSQIRSYQDKIDQFKKSRNYFEVAYFRGYQNALLGFLRTKIDSPRTSFAPKFYFEKIGEIDKRSFKKLFKHMPEIHKAAFSQCEQLLRKWKLAPGVIMQHAAWG